jgi:glutaconyl-CoA/methylmalonyl-CoA decarboxylase subunit gamma
MKLQVEIGDRVRTVEVRREPAGFQVLIDGRPRLVDAVQVTPGAWSLLVKDEGTVQSVEAVVSARPGNGTLDVYLDGLRIPVHVSNGRRRLSADAGSAGGSIQRISAPMPGKVVRVLVTPGAAVKARQGLVVVEAMKMENEVRALGDGYVREVLAVEGQSVDAGAPLVIVDGTA